MKRLIVALTIGVLAWSGVSQAQQVQQTPQGQQAPQPTKPMGSEFAKGWLTPILSVIYFPIKFSVGTAGAVLGGVSGWATGGNERAAEGIWRPMTGGTYFITPQVIDGERPFLPFDGGPYAPQPAGPVSSGSMYTQP
jgi:hypothetical protein